MPETTPTQLLERLAQGKPIPAIVLMGTDPYLRDMCRNGIIQAYVPDAVRDWALARISVQGGDWSELFQRAETLPMLAQLQVVIIDGAETIEVKKRDDDDAADADESDDADDPRKETLQAFSAYLDKPAPFTILLFEVPKLDKRQRLYKILNEKALIVELSIGDQAPQFAAQMAKELGAEIEPARGHPPRRHHQSRTRAHAHGTPKTLALRPGPRKNHSRRRQANSSPTPAKTRSGN